MVIWLHLPAIHKLLVLSGGSLIMAPSHYRGIGSYMRMAVWQLVSLVELRCSVNY
jgi:hypothetical protein